MVYIRKQQHHHRGEEEKALVAIRFGYISICMVFFLCYYCLYFDKNIEKIAAKYDKKIEINKKNG
jgi:amino acid permease